MSNYRFEKLGKLLDAEMREELDAHIEEQERQAIRQLHAEADAQWGEYGDEWEDDDQGTLEDSLCDFIYPRPIFIW